MGTRATAGAGTLDSWPAPRSPTAKLRRPRSPPTLRRFAPAAARLALTDVRVRSDGTVVVHSDEPGYRSVLRLSESASELVGTYVHVITDDVPGAAGASEL